MATKPKTVWDSASILADTFVVDVEVHETLASTNDRALELSASEQVTCPFLVLAQSQLQGRGRGQNTWWSAPGCLTFSLLLQPDLARLPLSRWPEMSLTVGSSICTALAKKLPSEPIHLKWPNDVYLRGAKVSGVLVEIAALPRPRVVIGVGLNVNNSLRSAPVELQSKLIALCDVGAEIPLQAILVDLLRELDVQLRRLADSPQEVRTLWRTFDLLTGRQVSIDDGISRVCGICVGIHDDGALMLLSDGDVKRCYSGVVEHWE